MSWSTKTGWRWVVEYFLFIFFCLIWVVYMHAIESFNETDGPWFASSDQYKKKYMHKKLKNICEEYRLQFPNTREIIKIYHQGLCIFVAFIFLSNSLVVLFFVQINVSKIKFQIFEFFCVNFILKFGFLRNLPFTTNYL